jgi:hypothetical protein
MSRWLGSLAGVIVFVAATYLVGVTRVRLDAIVEGEAFHEALYLPSGNTLKISALGFDQPVADALFVKSLIYFSQGWTLGEIQWAKRGYIYELFDAITDLSPRFDRAYQMGSMFLASSPDVNAAVNGARLLEKGVAHYDRLEKEGRDLGNDPRWMLHSYIANIYDVNVQIYKRGVGDLIGASEARQTALQQFRLSAGSPGAPAFMVQVAAGYEQMMRGDAGLEKSLEAAIAVWREAYERAVARDDKDTAELLGSRLEEQIGQLDAINATKAIQEALSEAGRRYKARNGVPAENAARLKDAGLIPGLPKTPLGTEDRPDMWLALPDGSFKSRTLADMETTSHMYYLTDQVADYVKAFPGRPLYGFDDLIAAGLLDKPPVPPLAALGQTYDFDSRIGVFVSRMPFGPEPPTRAAPEKK